MTKALRTFKNVADIQDEVGAGQFVSKPQLCALGSFILCGVSRREKNLYNGKDIGPQWIFEAQITGESGGPDTVEDLAQKYAGEDVLVSMDVNVVRDKIARAIQKHGAIGPYYLYKKGDAYVFGSNDVTTDDHTQLQFPESISPDEPPFSSTPLRADPSAPLPADPSGANVSGNPAAKRARGR